jgi:hypothetical protein
MCEGTGIVSAKSAFVEMNPTAKTNMKQKLALLVLVPVFLFTGCNRTLVLKTPLEPDEKVIKGDVVFVDGNPAGHVNQIVVEGQQRMALFAINDETVAKEKMRVGVIRVLEDGKISLRTGGADARSPMLANGETVPVMSKTGFAVRHFASNKVLTAVMAGLAVVALALFCFRRLARGWLLLLTLVLSGFIAWVALPWTRDAVAKIYTLLPQAAAAAAVGSSQDAGAESVISRLMKTRPSPEVVAYAAVFVAMFIGLSMVMRSSLKRLEGQI